MKKNVHFLAQAAIIAALYTVLTLALSAFSFGAIQCRISEALNVLTFFTPAAIPGLTVGCFLSNLLGGGNIFDLIFGTLATLLAAVVSYRIRKHRWLVPVPAILSNALIIPFVLRYAYTGIEDSIPFLMLTVGIGEFISAGILGMILLHVLSKLPKNFFRYDKHSGNGR